MFGSVRVIIMAVVFIGISGVGVYVMKLRSDNAILQANQIQLELSIESQKQVIEKQKQEASDDSFLNLIVWQQSWDPLLISLNQSFLCRFK